MWVHTFLSKQCCVCGALCDITHCSREEQVGGRNEPTGCYLQNLCNAWNLLCPLTNLSFLLSVHQCYFVFIVQVPLPTPPSCCILTDRHWQNIEFNSSRPFLEVVLEVQKKWMAETMKNLRTKKSEIKHSKTFSNMSPMYSQSWI